MASNAQGLVIKGSLDNEKVDKGTREIFEWGSSLLFAFSVCTLFTLFFMFFTVSGDSMLPTLHNNDKLLVYKFRYEPQKGEIVTIDCDESLGKSIIKRVIATPGDTLRINYDTHELFVNGQLLNENYINEPTRTRGDGFIPNNTTVSVPDGHVLVLGDNRNHSLDSRYSEVGLVNIDDLYGRASVRHWPLGSMRLF